MDAEDDFIEITPPSRASQSKVDTTLVNVSYHVVGKKKIGKLLVTVPKAVYDAMCLPTDRVIVAYSPKKSLVRLSHSLEDKFELSDVPPGRVSANAVVKRPRGKMLRFPAPSDLATTPGTRRACEYEVQPGSVTIKLPGDWYRTYSSAETPAKIVANKPVATAPQPKPLSGLVSDYGLERVKEHPVGRVLSEPGMPPPGRSALDQGAKPGGGLAKPSR